MALRGSFLIAALALVACVRPNPELAGLGSDNNGPDNVDVPSDLGSPGKPGADLASAVGPHDLGAPHDFAVPVDLKWWTNPDLKFDPPDLSMPPVVGVPCGPMTCMDPQYCCVSLTMRSCQDPGMLTCVGKKIACDGPEDCGNGACCSDPNGTSCSKSGDCGNLSVTICHTVDDCGGGAKGCCPSSTAGGGLKYCSKTPC
jgi:hypothetical protein